MTRTLYEQMGVLECVHILCRHHCVGDFIQKWRSVRWNGVCMWKYEFFMAEMHGSAMQSYVKHWLIMPCKVGTGIFGSVVLQILWQDLKMRKIAAKWMPHNWNEVQQWSCYETCHNRLERFCRKGGMLNWINTISEMWVQTYEWGLKNQALPVIIHIYYENASFDKIDHPRSWWSFCLLLCHPIPRGHIVNAQYYQSFLQYHLCCATREKHPELAEHAIILCDNAIAHSVDTVKNVLWCGELEVLQHHPCSPDLISCVCFLILKLK